MRRFILSVCLLGALVAAAAPASATVVERQHYSGTEAFAFPFCDFPLDVVSTFRGNYVIRATDGEAFLIRDTFRRVDVMTNPETGEWFTIRHTAVFHEIKATLIEGTIYQFVAVEAGQPFVIVDSEGNVVVRDRGMIRHTFLADTLGDGVPSAEEIPDTDVHDISGPHEGFSEDFDFCALAAELTGA